ncbi:phospholipid/cholesterol/gamma-HCH transport system substrate-binding protein [Litoreibacter ponti]|uniref:Phospholipid/cholesterol/gamma-HCH transport system substrate-binding protein n=1 Tax=Litoreibacter ponti TaxID=1510457 RepID=A0A2T6BJP2_9RHOB|nr:outer membrane lipid asymmetry maintenance protein MlaD [Litoreibacter ponti]PTX56274.1 phospholipid/cholesterol/gamma-HCH transport system substrate-binding protein [Litoreibacter ponti]
MAENTTEVVVGTGVLAVAVGFLVYATGATSLAVGGDSYPLTASFRSAEGVSVGTDVRMAGVKVGTVTGLDLNPTTFRADATFTMQSDIEVPDDSAISVSSEGLLGGSFVEVIPGGSPFNLEPGGEIEDTQSSVSLITLLMKFVAGSEE